LLITIGTTFVYHCHFDHAIFEGVIALLNKKIGVEEPFVFVSKRDFS
jgi:hypothetical protein